MDRSPPARARSVAAWTGLIVLLLSTVAGLYALVRHLERAGPSSAANQLLLPFLSIAVVVLLLGLAGVLIRNMVRLIVDRKRGVLGARLRTKLVFFFLALVLPPALVLFYGSATIIKMTVDAMVRTPVESVAHESQAIVDDWVDFIQDRCVSQAEQIGVLLRGSRDRALPASIEDRRDREGLDLIVVTRGEAEIAAARSGPISAPGLDDTCRKAVRQTVQEALRTGVTARRLDYIGDGLLAQAAVPQLAEDGTVSGTVVVGMLMPPEVSGRFERIDAATVNYRRFRGQRRELVALYLSVIALIFLTTVFVATWMGFYLSRRITGPVQALANASREISTGNLGIRVESKAGDELGVLVAAFNEMAAQLQESQEVITRSTGELRRSNQALDERRRYIETLLANLSTAVLSVDTRGCITTANPACRRILGVQPRPGEEVVEAIRSVDGLEALSRLVDQHRGTGGDVTRELTLTRNGERVAVAVQVSPLYGRGGDSLGTLLMVEDLTDLLRAQKAAAWREVARRIAHEIKNPLTPIQLAAQRLRKKFQEGSPDLDGVVREGTAAIEREVGALKAMVDEFSRFARMPEVTPRSVDFGEVIESVLALYRGQPGVRWTVDTDPGIVNARVDAEQIRRALINLIDNAIAAMDGAGTITIRARAHAGPGSLRIEVADTGPGIPRSDRDKMFVPYFSTKGRGTGLGLAIVHRVVTDHRGAIRVEDNEPSGARFVIEIPA